MTGLLFDTSAVIGLVERGSPTLLDVSARTTAPISVSPVTLGELELGVRREPTDRRRASLDVARSTMVATFFDPASGPACYAVIADHVGRGVGANDVWIAATAITAGHTLVTQDSRLAAALAGIDWPLTAWVRPDVELVPVGS